MFENSAIAKQVLELFLTINGQMNESIAAIERTVSAEELKAFKKGVGYVMYEAFDKVIEPICQRHPSLRPAEMEG